MNILQSEDKCNKSIQQKATDTQQQRRWQKQNRHQKLNNYYTDKNKYHINYLKVQLVDSEKPIEIKDCGIHIISTSVSGDSVVVYEPEFLGDEEGEEYFNHLFDSTKWHNKNIFVSGEEKPQPRMVAWFGPYPYSYSRSILEPAEMPDCILEIKRKVEVFLKEMGIIATFNSVLLNMYRTGKDYVGWHSDDELSLGICPTIASVSLGETRKFEMRPKKKYSEDGSLREKQANFFVHLTHGSLLIMDGCMQEDWQHRVRKEYDVKNPRINLTFRTVYPLKKVSHKVSRRESKKKITNSSNSNKTPSFQTNFNDADPPLSTDENFPTSSNDVDPSFVHPCSDVQSDCHDRASSSSSRNEDSNKSYENLDCESSFKEKIIIENDIPNYDNSLDISLATNDVKSAERNNVTDRAFEMNSVEKEVVDSKECPVSENYLHNEEPPKKSLNVLAKEFIPNFIPVLQTPDYSQFSLEELCDCNIELMCGAELWSFASNFRIKVAEKLPEFSRFVREELEFLCRLTDGNQSEKIQELITSRMVNIISNNLQRLHSRQDIQYYNQYPRSQNYRKQNRGDRGKKPQYYHNQGRS